MFGVENSVLTGRSIPNLTCADQRYSIPSQTDQKTQITGLKNLSFIARLFIYIKEKFTHKYARPFSQILYKLDVEALRKMSKFSQLNFLLMINNQKTIYKLSNLRDYKDYFKKKFPDTFAREFSHLNKKPS
jgi:hypothetical protein